MDRLNYVEIQEELPKIIEKVCNDRAPVIITTDNYPPVVLMSLEDYQSYEETLYLLKSPQNAQSHYFTQNLHSQFNKSQTFHRQLYS